MYKKGEAFKMLNYSIWRILFVSIVFFFVYKFASSYIHINIDVYQVKSEIFTSRVVNSPGISFQSEYNYRTYPWIINYAMFKNETLERQFNNASDRFSASLYLDNQKQEILLNKKWYDRDYPLKKFDKYHDYMYFKYALVKNESVEGGRLVIKTIEHE